MPRAKKTGKTDAQEIKPGKYAPRESGEVDWGGFINVPIDDATKEVYASWLEAEGQYYWMMLSDTLAEGMKYSLAWDAENGCFIASFTGCAVSVSASRFCMTARSDSLEDATSLLVFKHYVMAQGDWGSYRPRTRSFMTWG
jgi:hypothetical protein